MNNICYRKYNEPVGIKLVSKLLGTSISHVRNLADKGEIPSIRSDGGHRRFDMRAVFKAIGASILIDENLREELYKIAIEGVKERQAGEEFWFGKGHVEESIAIMEFRWFRSRGYSPTWEITDFVAFPPDNVWQRGNVVSVSRPTTVGELGSYCLTLVGNTMYTRPIMVELEKKAIATFEYSMPRLNTFKFALTGLGHNGA